jgi:short-subunit dehydrogenase
MVMKHTVLLTGATGGIGQEISKALCAEGHTLVLTGRNADRLLLLERDLLRKYPQAEIFPLVLDITSKESRDHLVAELEDLPVQVDILINNAGMNDFGLYQDQTEEMISQLIATNAIAPMLLTKAVLSYFEKTGLKSQVINIGSTFGSIAYPGFTAYSASKFALRGASEALSREYADTNIRVRYFAPRATKTDLNNDAVVRMNAELNVHMDSPEYVAKELLAFMHKRSVSRFLGWPEKLFVFLNQLCPSIVSGSLQKALPAIRRYARSE